MPNIDSLKILDSVRRLDSLHLKRYLDKINGLNSILRIPIQKNNVLLNSLSSFFLIISIFFGVMSLFYFLHISIGFYGTKNIVKKEHFLKKMGANSLYGRFAKWFLYFIFSILTAYVLKFKIN